MTGCAPSLAQALLPYPQYCGKLQGLNENQGTSTYHSLQAKVEKRFSGGTYLLVSYTWSKLMTSGTDNVQREAHHLERRQRCHLALRAGPQPGPGRRTTSPTSSRRRSSTTSPSARGGSTWTRGAWPTPSWAVGSSARSSATRRASRSSSGPASATFPASSGPAASRRSRTARTSSPRTRAASTPRKGPLFDKNAFESIDAFNFNYGTGARVTSYRGFGYHNQDLSLIKNTSLGGGINLQLRIEAFNLWNWHIFSSSGEFSAATRLQHRHREPRLRQVERERDQPAERPGRVALRVLADGSAPARPGRPGRKRPEPVWPFSFLSRWKTSSARSALAASPLRL